VSRFLRSSSAAERLTRRQRYYISQARQCRPTVPAAVSNYVVESYVKMRKLSKDEDHQNKSHTYTSPRTLLGILRLSQALARLRFANAVEEPDVDEALRLMAASKESLVDESEREGGDTDRSATSKIFRLIKDMADSARSGRKGRRSKRAKRLGKGPGGERDMDVDSDEEEDEEELLLVDVRSRALGAGFTEAQLMETVESVRVPCIGFRAKVDLYIQYERMDVLMRVANGSKLRILSAPV
jgi:DNA replication licensing factor MCM7